MGTCEQRDTGQGHPDKGTGQRTDDYLQIHGHFFWNGRIIGFFLGIHNGILARLGVKNLFL